jgi:hypothetical protein
VNRRKKSKRGKGSAARTTSVRERSSRSIAIGIHQGNEEDPIEAFSVLIEDSGDLDSMLTEAVVRGFNEAIAFAWRSYRLSHRPVGRPFSNRIMMQGQRAAELHSKGLELWEDRTATMRPQE